MDEVAKAIIWKVHCPVDGPQLLRQSGLHVFLRDGLREDVVSYFCPQCSQQRWQLVMNKVSQALIDDLGVAYSVMDIPREALEPHHGPVISEAWISECQAIMDSPGWPPAQM